MHEAEEQKVTLQILGRPGEYLALHYIDAKSLLFYVINTADAHHGMPG